MFSRARCVKYESVITAFKPEQPGIGPVNEAYVHNGVFIGSVVLKSVRHHVSGFVFHRDRGAVSLCDDDRRFRDDSGITVDRFYHDGSGSGAKNGIIDIVTHYNVIAAPVAEDLTFDLRRRKRLLFADL